MAGTCWGAVLLHLLHHADVPFAWLHHFMPDDVRSLLKCCVGEETIDVQGIRNSDRSARSSGESL